MALYTNIGNWEELTSDQVRWRQELRRGLDKLEAKQRQAAEEKCSWTLPSEPVWKTATPVLACTVTASDAPIPAKPATLSNFPGIEFMIPKTDGCRRNY